jgi:predicted aldo/keto reductase-like oxidoreductase
LQKRRLGRTNLKVSQVGFGGTWISELSTSDAIAVVRRAFSLGINYFDTARLDGDSEEKIGAALKEVREQCIIATKTGSRTKQDSLDDLQNSLKRLQTNHLDIIQLHGIDDEKTLSKAIGTDGSLQTCKQARRQGLVDFIGITGHKPQILVKAVESGEFDTVLVPINVVTRQAIEELLPVAKENDVGVVVMKPLSAKTSNLITCLYQPTLSLISQEPELKALLGESSDEMVRSALRYVLSQDISVVVPGLRSLSEVGVAAKVGNEYSELSAEEKQRFRIDLGDYCRDCGQCLPCLNNVNIPAVLRFHSFQQAYGLKNWAKKLYSGLEVKATKCSSCGECEAKCPYKLPIKNKLRKAHHDLRNSI